MFFMFLQERYISPKRTKPSLSIVNPLDVLRQRVLLEMARRQRENANKQAEINKEILKSIGKRGGNSANSLNDDDIEIFLKNRYYDFARHNTPLENHQKIPREKFNIKPQSNDNEKTTNKASNEQHSSSSVMNTPNQQKVYIIDDSSSNNLIGDEGDDDETRLFFEFLRNRLYKSY